VLEVLHSEKQTAGPALEMMHYLISKVEEAISQKESKLTEVVNGEGKIFDVFEVPKQQFKERTLLNSSKSYLL